MKRKKVIFQGLISLICLFAVSCFATPSPTAGPSAIPSILNPRPAASSAPVSPSLAATSSTNSLGMKFVSIPPGTFMMGSPESEQSKFRHETQHQVTLTKGFSIQTTEVTQGQWTIVMGSNPSRFKGDELPVEQVSWDDTQEFIAKLNVRGEGKFRLPTEAEWEYAARAGSNTAFANGGISELECGFDPVLDAMGWYCYNSGNQTHPVAQKQPNAWGLYDMHGNVYEWVQDWYGEYPSGSVSDPLGPSSGSYRVELPAQRPGIPGPLSSDSFRVNRGCNWNRAAQFCRSAYRSYDDPSYRLSIVGFRLVKEP